MDIDILTGPLAIHEAFWRIGFFAFAFFAFAGIETLKPYRHPSESRPRRWVRNLTLNAGGIILIRLFLPLTAVQFSAWVVENHWGVFQITQWPFWLEGLCSVLILDLAIYTQHVVFHYVPILWRLHRVHHSDQHYDLSTGIRFHPIELFISMCLKFAVIALIGAGPVAVLAFEILLNTTSLFNHSNFALPMWMDRVLRWFVVPPDMHRIHHSRNKAETNSNFGFNLTWWDRLFRTYRTQSQLDPQTMPIGIQEPLLPQDFTLKGLLVLPFHWRRPTGETEKTQ